MNDYDDEVTELEVTLTFPLPVNTGDALGPRELATQMRDRLIDDPSHLVDVVRDAVDQDYVLQVKPFNEF